MAKILERILSEDDPEIGGPRMWHPWAQNVVNACAMPCVTKAFT